ncbi:FAD synthetase family protein [Neobacillus sp. OS1-2]|uniref:FAD synthetase family protein n=1 Tax=Neobacillus sp. OS1-2 TaxID=3070680 RepID=UPI0027DFE325|nr:FAD synthetase family protein [Neobacillus sp. OS1-2]WML39147.1 FAD synthetase family protein [Neobacillus sp. OS1-2]
METIYLNPENLKYWQEKAKSSVMALGFFDGIHIGHREVIQTAGIKAKEENLLLTVMSFFPHPKTVLSNGQTRVDYLMPLAEKEKLFSELGVDIFYIVEFDRGFASLSPETFAAKYLLDLGVVHAVAGFDYTYGFRGEGNMDRLQKDSGGILKVTKVKKVECFGEKISSSSIREKLSKGSVGDLPALLGRSYAVDCEWDGGALKVKPYFTLPAYGTYSVTLTGGCHSQEMDVIVVDEKKLIPLLSVSDLVLNNENAVSVTWHQRIVEEGKKTISENKWLRSSKFGFVWSG